VGLGVVWGGGGGGGGGGGVWWGYYLSHNIGHFLGKPFSKRKEKKSKKLQNECIQETFCIRKRVKINLLERGSET